MKDSKKISILLWISSTSAIILAHTIFSYFRSMSMLRNLGYSETDAGFKLLNVSLSSLLFSVFIAVVLFVSFKVISKKRNENSFANIEKEERNTNSLNPKNNEILKNKDKALEICREFNDTSDEVGASIFELSSFTENQATNVEQLSAAMEELSSGVQQTAENIQQASNFVSTIHGTISILTESIGEVAVAAEAMTKESEGARTAVKDGEKIITDAIGEMNNVSIRIKDLADSISVLGESAEQIGKIIEVINNIANQTNMLSLNASIEAARAGEYGRGFAVVAKSIKELSDRSKDATSSISEIIRKIQVGIEEAVEKSNKGLIELEAGMSLVKASGDSISNILSVVDKTNEYAASVTESTKLQDESRKEVMESIDELSSVIQEISATTMQESASVQQVASGVEEVKECIDELAAGTQEIVTFTSAISEGWKQLIEILEAKK